MKKDTITTAALRFPSCYAALTAAHEGADHLVQRDSHAVVKGRPGAEGRRACARHVAEYTVVQAAALLLVDRGLGLRLNWRYAATGLALSAATHYLADRSGGRWSEDPETQQTTRLVRFAHLTGKGNWLRRDPQAGYRIDQAWHKSWIALAAGVAAAGGAR
ncbi:hypothetical protein [Streptomyces ipomoeae]|uniref:hypothetical protein n=1 Tax=Streptomyces ipomoeae TaxID=103232 RepID=UPI00114739F3|nr:hypothetical protein [Streptomyces ipomoeae]TQE33148.1 hypothetical protein Sipo7851_21895 [Streptomyces ipomoeae]